MKTKYISSMIALIFAFAGAVSAQELTLVQDNADWALYTGNGNCYAVSQPETSRALRGGSEVSVSRGDIRLFVTVANGRIEPSFVAGYPLDSSNAISVDIGGREFNFYGDPNAASEYAWPLPSDDNALISAMKAGVNAEITGISTRGTTTIDVFSLSGFTATIGAAQSRCSG